VNEFKGTPGPWKVDYWLDGEPSVMFDGPALTRVCRMEYVVKAGAVPNDEMEANAELIAAAPNLFKELQLVLDYEEQSQFERWMEIADPSGDCEFVQRQWLESAEYEDFRDLWSGPISAIAKALGE
jgi:hypothetical protein